MDQNDPLTHLAKIHFGIDYLFPYQRLVISNILEAAGVSGFAPEPSVNPVTDEKEISDTKPYQIVILPTGAGKSLCFMLPCVLLDGATLVVFPLLSLIADQARRLILAGMKPGILRGGQSRVEREEVWAGVKSGKIKMILTNPETALHPKVLPKLKELKLRHMVIDEMHTVSEWGESFRPVYLEIGRLPKEAGIPVVTAFTATASPLILGNVKNIVFPDVSPNIITANPDRPNIYYRVLPCLSKNHELVELLRKGTQSVERPAIVFCGSRTGTEMTARILRRRLGEDRIFFYHAGLTREEKTRIEQWFFDSDDGILIATCAYGMGVDKADVRTVIHMDIPSSVEAYLQESGRAGRDRKKSTACLLFSLQDSIRADTRKDVTVKERFKSLVRYAANRNECRRDQLLSLLGTKPEGCFGCDVCDRTAKVKASGIREITAAVRKNKRRLSIEQLRTILSGDESYYQDYILPVHVSGFGTLKDWTKEDIDEAIRSLLMQKDLRLIKRGFWKGKLSS